MQTKILKVKVNIITNILSAHFKLIIETIKLPYKNLLLLL